MVVDGCCHHFPPFPRLTSKVDNPISRKNKQMGKGMDGGVERSKKREDDDEKEGEVERKGYRAVEHFCSML